MLKNFIEKLVCWKISIFHRNFSIFRWKISRLRSLHLTSLLARPKRCLPVNVTICSQPIPRLWFRAFSRFLLNPAQTNLEPGQSVFPKVESLGNNLGYISGGLCREDGMLWLVCNSLLLWGFPGSLSSPPVLSTPSPLGAVRKPVTSRIPCCAATSEHACWKVAV